jgi:hypothetical protein
MYRHPILSLSFLVLTALIPSVIWAAQAVHKGKVVSVGDGKIAIVDQDDEQEEFAVAKDAKITHDGKPATLDDLDNGDTVKITTKKVDGKEVAIEIEAKSKT